ncbi:WD40/YVTN/BNR-like repeat-containing protein [Kitasatospora sp. McL0602]|uniref:WD40/YVTN/BNR-like repeat-containing protein n=1 Tax=Kitasatospora sp. McL0602 TaxID=3439530 RepID=UPI003F8A37C5
MSAPTRNRRWLTICAVAATMGLIGVPASAAARPGTPYGLRLMQAKAHQPGGAAAFSAKAAGEGDGGEADAVQEGADQRAEARTSPGIVAPGAFGAAWAQLTALPQAGGDWKHLTGLPYDSDDPRYRDTDSNSSAGMGKVTGRAAAVVADDRGHVYEGSAGGGVWRSSTGGGHWQPISDQLPTQATGALALDGRGRLWLGTGEANTNSDAYLGAGVFVLAHPEDGEFGPRSRVGGAELDSATVHAIRFGGDRAWAATSKGVWSHSLSDLTGPWQLEFAPNPDYLPGGPLAADPNAPYKNITTDVAIDPRDASKVVLAVGWRGGDSYNGFYTKTAGSWQRLASLGDLPADAANVGSVTFARSADGSRYYAVDQSPQQLNNDPSSALAGIFVSKSGSPMGPWTRIADYHQLAASGSGLTQESDLPGQQSWYDQSLQVDPTNPDHVYAGLEEIFETSDGGANWKAVGPYWNFNFSCWSIDPTKQTGDCSPTTHPDQHGLAVGSYQGRPYLFAGNDGGLYRRPLVGQTDAAGHATDWTSLNDGTIDTLQYYSVGIGKDPAGHGVAVNGGLQDNGQSILRPRDRVMGSNFGGDGGDTLTDPANGCNIAQEYVYLAVNVTQNCGVNDGSWLTDPSKATSFAVAPPDNALGGAGARFIAPLSTDVKNNAVWVAGGRHVWVQTQGYAIRSSDAWKAAYDLGAGHVATAVAASGGKVYAAWCGPCNNQGFTRGIAVGNADGTGWQQLTLPADGSGVPNRYLSGLTVDPADSTHVYLAVNGFSRHWTEGPGTGLGHLYESRDSGAHWTDISANLPDAPADSLVVTPNGGLALATDLGVVYRAPHRTTWQRLGELPAVAVDQLKIGPDHRLYAATHGRGLWSMSLDD